MQIKYVQTGDPNDWKTNSLQPYEARKEKVKKKEKYKLG